MSYERCERCKGHGFICLTCGKPRGRSSSRKYPDVYAHPACVRRPKGLAPCPNHTDSCVRCDYCGATAPSRQPTWSYNERGHACAKCTEHLSIASDAVGFDMGAAMSKAAHNLIGALGRIDWNTLNPHQRKNLRLALVQAIAMAPAGDR